jgi:hypothetical protein
MKMTVLCAGLSAPHAGWVAIDELAFILATCFDAELRSSPERPGPWLRRMAGRAKPRFAPIASSGGDVLIVVARGPGDLAMAAAIKDVRRKFARIHAFVTDSYFQAGFVDETALYDSITVTAHEDVAYPAERFGIKVHQLYQGTDCLRWAPRQDFAREIDIMAFGRTPPSYQACFTKRFHAPDSPICTFTRRWATWAAPACIWSGACCSSCRTARASRWPITCWSSRRATGPNP